MKTIDHTAAFSINIGRICPNQFVSIFFSVNRAREADRGNLKGEALRIADKTLW